MDMDDEFELDEDIGAETDVTPIVNVSLILVLVFMVTSPFIVKDLLNVTLPTAVTSKSEREENITITISPTEGFAVNEIPLKREALEMELVRHIQKSGITYVLIRSDERVPFGEVQEMLKTCKRLGARRIAFATVPKGR
jgi:biopolymer transport protein ExbD